MIMRIHFALFMFFLLPVVAAYAMPIKSLDAFSWSNRLVLVFCKSGDEVAFSKPLEKSLIHIDDRDILWFVVSEQQLLTNFSGPISPLLKNNIIQDWVDPDRYFPQVVVIGKDGDEKLRHSRLDLENIFGLIDQMPMRRLEMRQVD